MGFVKMIKIVLVGQPNVGKSMLINSVSNSKLKVGNFSGVTVEKKEVDFKYKDYQITIVDLPGSYTLNGFSPDEKVTTDFLKNEEYDLIVNVVDSTNLERNLLLTTQLLELNRPMILALNMIDEANKEGIEINSDQLSSILGIQAIKVSAVKHIGIENLLSACTKNHENSNKLIYSDTIEEEISHIIRFLEEKSYKCPNKRELAIKILQEDTDTYKKMHANPIWVELSSILRESLDHIYTHNNTKNLNKIFRLERASFVRGALMETVNRDDIQRLNTTRQVDLVLINKIIGIPIFFFLMWVLFQLTFEIGSIPMDYIDATFVYLGDMAKEIFGENQFSSLLSDGIIAGVGAVVLFLPNIMILFLGIALLETTGYMSRIAFLLDGFFHKFGLHGKSFIPLVTGFGCSVPAYMSARTLKNEKDRLITLFIIGFMNCGARLPIYVLFAGAFFEKQSAGNVLFTIYIAGAMLGLIFAKLLRIFVFKGENEPFVMEMPKYRLPSLKLVWHTVINKAWMYIKKAGTFILLASIIIWFASTYPKYQVVQNEFNTKIELTQNTDQKQKLQNELDKYLLENSYLGKIGKFTEPVFAPLGFDWRMTVALETGLAAKEVVVSTLGILYSLGSDVDQSSEGLISKIKNQIPFASAIAFIVFVMIYLPCFAASLVFAKEAGGFKYLGYLFVFTSITAWILSFIAYNIASLI